MTRYGGIHINNDNSSPTDGADWDTDRWQISERDTNQFDIAHGTPTHTNVAASDTKLRVLTDGKVGINKGSSDPAVELDVTGSGKFSSNLEIDGALNHDGSTVGFYGVAPVTRQAGPAAVNSIGSTGTPADPETNADTINALITALTNLGLLS